MQADAELACRVGLTRCHDRVDLGIGDDRRQMLGRQIGRTENEAARNAVELDQRQCGGELITGRDQHRAARELGQPAAQAGATREVAQRDVRVASMELGAAICGFAQPVAQ